MTTELAAEVICGEVLQGCVCVLKPRHTGAHECSCDGSWTGAGDSLEEIVRYPRYAGARSERLQREETTSRPGVPDDVPCDRCGVPSGEHRWHHGDDEHHFESERFRFNK